MQGNSPFLNNVPEKPTWLAVCARALLEPGVYQLAEIRVSKSMSWDDEVREIRARRVYALEQGGEAGVSRQHKLRQATVRERIDQLLDEGSFREHGRMAGAAAYLDDDGAVESFTPANYVVGLGTVNERRVAIGGEDFHAQGWLSKCRWAA